MPIFNLSLTHLIDNAKCFKSCARCAGKRVLAAQNAIVQASSSREKKTRNRIVNGIGARAARLTLISSDTIFAGHHQPLGMWILCLYLMGLNLSNQKIAQELDIYVLCWKLFSLNSLNYLLGVVL